MTMYSLEQMPRIRVVHQFRTNVDLLKKRKETETGHVKSGHLRLQRQVIVFSRGEAQHRAVSRAQQSGISELLTGHPAADSVCIRFGG